MRVFGIVLTLVVLMFCTTTPAAAEDPFKIILGGGPLSRVITITDLRDTGAITVHLCSGRHAGSLAHRPGIRIVIQWLRTPSSAWTGKFYPAIDDQPAAVNIPAFKLYYGAAMVLYCDRRLAGAKALALLAKYHVPTRIIGTMSSRR
jgi:hypothetical protein